MSTRTEDTGEEKESQMSIRIRGGKTRAAVISYHYTLIKTHPRERSLQTLPKMFSFPCRIVVGAPAAAADTANILEREAAD